MNTSPSSPAQHENKAEATRDKVSDNKGKKRGFFLVLAAVLLMGFIAWAVWYVADGRWQVSTDDAYVQGDLAPINSQVAATVVQVYAREGDFVPAGTPLLQLDDTDAQVALAQAKAALANAVRQSHGLYAQASSAHAGVQGAQAALASSQSDLARTQALAKKGMVSKEALNHAQETVVAKQSALTQAQQAQNAQQNLIAGVDLSAQPAVEVAAAQLRAAYLRVQRSRILSPMDGYVAKRSVQVGQLAQAGQPLMAVAALGSVWVEANFKETQLTDLRLGQPVAITADIYGGKVKYQGVIDSLGMGTGSAFSLLPAQNATGNWIKVTQRVPVRIQLKDPGQLRQHPLRLGLSVSATVDTHQRDGALLAAAPRHSPVQQTSIFDAQLQAADALVASTIAANVPR
jgi:membrane fusion protein (multidrug efflux system)